MSGFILKKHINYGLKKDSGIPIPTTLTDYIIIVGYGTFGTEVAGILKQDHKPYLAIDYDTTKVILGEKIKDNVIFGNITQRNFLEKLNLENVKCIIITIDNTSIIKAICDRILDIVPNIRIIAKVDYETEEKELHKINVNSINSRHEIAMQLVRYATDDKKGKKC
nr:NAD(P)-binding protein [Helicobacter sp. 13S00477-4]